MSADIKIASEMSVPHSLGKKFSTPLDIEVVKLVLWLNANFKTGFRKRKFGEKPGIFDLSNAKK